MLENYNILELFEKVEQQEKEIAEMKAEIFQLKSMFVGSNHKENLNVVEDSEGYFTVQQIIKNYCCSRASFYNYQTRFGKLRVYKVGDGKNKYLKKDVKELFKKVDIAKTGIWGEEEKAA